MASRDASDGATRRRSQLPPSACHREEKEEKGTATAKVEVAEVESTSFEHRIRVPGNVETDEDVMLTADMGGLITSVRVKEGQLVNKGTIIATVDGATLN